MDNYTKILNRFGRKATVVVALLMLLLIAAPVLAQNYRFAVDEMDMQLFVQRDASARIVYDITFANQPGAHPIDIVDIGMPHEDYELSTMEASVNDVPVTDIRPSTFVEPGVEIHLGSQTIPAGERDTLHLEFAMPDLVFQDVTDRELASLQITPTWFGDEFVVGQTNLRIAIHLPEGVRPEEALYQEEPFSNKGTFQGRTVGIWEFPDTRLTGPHPVGISFPKRVMDRVVSMNLFQLAVRWFENSPGVRVVTGIINMILFTFLFFRFSGGTGWSVWFILGAVQIYLYVQSPAFHLLSIPGMVALVLINEGYRQRRKKKYLPAIAQVEGGGIKRGLTAPEAAALLALPINKVLTLIIFGMLKKGVLEQVKDAPLTVVVTEAFRAKNKGDKKRERDAHRRQVAQEKGIVLHKYEQNFLEILEDKSETPIHEIDLSGPMERFLAYTANRIKGFDLSDTQDYYRRIVERALVTARSMGDIPEREKEVDRGLEWILMGDEEEYRPIFESGPRPYRPIWMRPLVLPGGRSSSPAPRPSTSGTGPGFGDVAAGFAGWAENTMGDLASTIMPGSIEAAGGAVDLSGFDRATADVFEALASSSGSGGGSGGCACAGCACACACAGGGR